MNQKIKDMFEQAYNTAYGEPSNDLSIKSRGYLLGPAGIEDVVQLFANTIIADCIAICTKYADAETQCRLATDDFRLKNVISAREVMAITIGEQINKHFKE